MSLDFISSTSSSIVLFLGGSLDGVYKPLSTLPYKVRNVKVLETVLIDKETYCRHQVIIKDHKKELTCIFDIYVTPEDFELSDIFRLLMFSYKRI